ncbi:hypothetical protein MPC1_810005 [Methylocella tundrae]|nr:hypothetical protein MPC1_810005 [Methylocella tundrae]
MGKSARFRKVRRRPKRLVLMGFMRSPHRLRGKNHGRAAIAPAPPPEPTMAENDSSVLLFDI